MATDYKSQIAADVAALSGQKDNGALNAYLATTTFTPQQIAEVTGLKSGDLASAMNAARTDGGQGYFSANPTVADDYYNDNKGMTLAEYAVDHWRNNGSVAGQGIVDNGDGSFGLNELSPLNQTYVSQFNDDQLKGIAKTWMEGKGDVMNLAGQMEKYGVGKEDVAYALSKYGNDYRTYDGARVDDSWQVDNLISAHRGQDFGGSTKDTAAFRELSPQEMQAVEWIRGTQLNGSYGGHGANIPGAISADSAQAGSKGYVTQREAEHAASMVRNANFWRGLDPTHSEAFEDPNFRQNLAAAANDSKARLRAGYDAGEGKVSPFAIGGSAAGSVNAPGVGWKGSKPGLGQESTFMAPKQRSAATSAPTTAATTTPGAPAAPAPAPAKPFDGTVPTERLAEARRYGLDLNQLTQQELATFVNSGWSGLSQSRQAEWNKQAANRPANPNLMS